MQTERERSRNIIRKPQVRDQFLQLESITKEASFLLWKKEYNKSHTSTVYEAAVDIRRTSCVLDADRYGKNIDKWVPQVYAV
jgi:hypothetical protein